MLKDFSWTVFEQTGSVESFLMYKELSDIARNNLQSNVGSEVDGTAPVADTIFNLKH